MSHEYIGEFGLYLFGSVLVDGSDGLAEHAAGEFVEEDYGHACGVVEDFFFPVVPFKLI